MIGARSMRYIHHLNQRKNINYWYYCDCCYWCYPQSIWININWKELERFVFCYSSYLINCSCKFCSCWQNRTRNLQNFKMRKKANLYPITTINHCNESYFSHHHNIVHNFEALCKKYILIWEIFLISSTNPEAAETASR